MISTIETFLVASLWIWHRKENTQSVTGPKQLVSATGEIFSEEQQERAPGAQEEAVEGGWGIQHRAAASEGGLWLRKRKRENCDWEQRFQQWFYRLLKQKALNFRWNINTEWEKQMDRENKRIKRTLLLATSILITFSFSFNFSPSFIFGSEDVKLNYGILIIGNYCRLPNC